VARALDLVGDRWALLVVRELLLGPKRFTDLRAGLPHVSPDVLSERLRDLEQAQVVRRDRLPPPAASRIYELTDWGHELEPAVLALGRWGSRAPLPASDGVFGVDSVMLALKTLFAAERAGELDASYELRLGEQSFRARVKNGRFELSRGSAEQPAAIIETDPLTMSSVLWHGRDVAEAMRSGELEIRGRRSAVKRFLSLFPVAQAQAIP
jgi:DNA-binding HxlR family transcriptional regulator